VFSGDGGPAASAGLNNTEGVTVRSDGTVVIVDSLNQRIRAVSPQGIIQTIAGNGAPRFAGDGGPAIDAVLNGISDVAVDPVGNVYVDDRGNNRIRKITTTGIVQTIAGNGQVFGNVQDGAPATAVPLFGASGTAADSAGSLYIALTGSILRVQPDGTVKTFVPNVPGAQVGQLALDKANNLYFAAIGDNRIYKVSPSGVMTVVAGNGTRGFTGDGGPATGAALNAPAGVAVDGVGTVYIADWFNNRIRVVTPAGTISTLSGTGQIGTSGDGGPAQAATLDTPFRLSLDAANNLYISTGTRIRTISPAGIITTIAGAGSLGDGAPAVNASISPNGLALDTAGNIFITDSSNNENRVREILVIPPTLTVSTAQLTFSGLSGGAPAPKQSISLSASIAHVSFTASISGGGSWLSISPASGATPRLIDVVADPANLPARSYQATITVSAPEAKPPSLTINVTFNVAAGTAPVLSVDSQSLSFSFPRSGPAQDQKLTVSNTGTGNMTFTTAASTTPQGSGWLKVSPSAGTVTPATPVVLTVSADPTGLAPGTYTGTVTINSSGGIFTVSVVMSISALDQAILLSQRGLSFLAIAGGGVVPPRTFSIMNIGSQPAGWTVSTSTLAGGADWLHATPAAGIVNAGSQGTSTVTVTMNPAGLAVGSYYGLVSVNAAGAANSPQVVTIFLQVLPPGTDAGVVVQPGSLLFTATAGGESPGSQAVTLYNITANSKGVHGATDGGVLLPSDALLDPQRPTQVVVQPVRPVWRRAFTHTL
jgi:sugar lactone lactonase YvrE